jgi:hypothetical protein
MAPNSRRKGKDSHPLQFLCTISESLEIQPRDVAHVEGQHITRHGNLVYPVRIRGRKVFVTIPERDSD